MNRWMLPTIAALVACSQPLSPNAPAEGDQPGQCDDGVDNDADSLTDCADPSCRLDPACEDPGTETESESESESETETETQTETETETETETGDPNHPCFPEPDPCPRDAAALGSSNRFTLHEAAITWRYDAACDISYGDPIHVRSSVDVVSYGITVDAGRAVTGIGYLALDGEPLIDYALDTGPASWDEAPFQTRWSAAASVVSPHSRESEPDSGCVAIVPIAWDDLRGAEGSVWLASRRYSSESVNFNFVIVNRTDIDESELSSTLYHLKWYLVEAGIDVDTVWSMTVSTPDGDTISSEGRAIDRLRASDLDADPQTVNVYFVQDFDDIAAYGISAGIPGAVAVQETAGSGVVVSVDAHLMPDFETLDTKELGATIAHEVGHHLGLYHTTERTGDVHDALHDTPECPSSRDVNRDGQVTPSECDGFGARYVMFWTTSNLPQNRWSTTQKDVLAKSPSMHK